MRSSTSRLIIALVVLVLAGIGYGVWYHGLAQKSALVASINTKISQGTVTAAHIESAKETLASVSSEEATLNSYFINTSEVVPFIDNLESLGTKMNAPVTILSVSGGTGTHPVLTLALSIKGTFSDVMNTVGAIEYAPYAVTISSLSIGKDAVKAWHADVNINVTATNATTTSP